MLRNYITIAFRHLARHKLFSLINILCLSIGITFSLVIAVYVLDQKGINGNLRNANQQYFIKSKWKEKDMGIDITSISPLSQTMKEQFPSLVANYFRYNPVTNVISAGDKHFKEDIAICDTTMVSMYGFPVLYGDPHRAFKDNSSAVITETMAKKLFGNANAIGKTINMQTTVSGVTQDYLVTAVLKDIPYTTVTHLVGDTYSVYVPREGNLYFQGGAAGSLSWDVTNDLAFVELQPGASPKQVAATMNTLVKKNSSAFVTKVLSVELVPVRNYYTSDNGGAVDKMIAVLSIVAVFILLMVIINFININIGTSTQRLKEIGLRKVFGGERKQLILQFMVEAWILTLLSGMLSVLIYQLLAPSFGSVLNTHFPAFWHFSVTQLGWLLGLVLFIGFAAGIYPAFVLSGSNLVNAVKGKIDSSKGGLTIRRILLVTQFSLAVMIFICTVNISRQVSFIFDKDLGYNKEQLVVITAFPKQWDTTGLLRMQHVKEELLSLPEVKTGTLAFDVPDRIPPGRIIMYPPGTAGTDRSVNVAITVVDEDYAKTFGMKLLAGSFFGDTKNGFIINETAVKQLGLTPQNAIGKLIQTPVAGPGIAITGVIKDFHNSSMQAKILPSAFVHVNTQKSYRFITLKLNTGDVAASMRAIAAKWKAVLPNAPFDYTFMDEKFAALYRSELQLQKAADIATVLNLVIIFLGIFGVVAFTLTRRTKEIAVRKVLGANPRDIISLFLKEYALLIVIANLVAWPVAYMATDKWLQGFAYKVPQSMLSYIGVFISVCAIAFVLISIQCFKTAIMNPVKNLRTE